jgi:hypothetical protein
MSSRDHIFITYYHFGNQYTSDKSDSEYSELTAALCRPRFDVTLSESADLDASPPLASPEEQYRKIRDAALKESAVTIVLISSDTWRRKEIDWEIAASLFEAADRPSSGLLGIVLPSFHGKRYPLIANDTYVRLENSRAYVSRRAVPERLAINLESGFARLYDWSDNPDELQGWIEEALQRRREVSPDNSLAMLRRNR